MFLFGIEGFSTVTQIGQVTVNDYPDFDLGFNKIKELSENSEVRCWDSDTSERMKQEIDKAKESGITLGGAFYVYYKNLPVGLGSYVHYDRAIDGLIAQAV